MGHRLSKIYTRTGDNGSTALGDGKRVTKDHPRVEAFGTVDELNSAIGLVLSITNLDAEITMVLTKVQHELFDLGGELCLPGYTAITEQHITHLEKSLDQFNSSLPPLKEFILPGGIPAAANCHLARTICRRAERRLVSLIHFEEMLAEESKDTASETNEKHDSINQLCLKYLNRLSDLLFVIARKLNHDAQKSETQWAHEKVKRDR